MKTPPPVIEECELAFNTVLLGYVIYLPERDEFLAYCQKAHGLVQRAFTRSPDHAKIYHSLDEVFTDARVCRESAEPCYLYHEGNHRPIAITHTVSSRLDLVKTERQPQEKHYWKVLEPAKDQDSGIGLCGKILRRLRQRLSSIMGPDNV